MQSANWQDDEINGVRDLIDFFPISLRIKELLDVLPSSDYYYELRGSDTSLGFVDPLAVPNWGSAIQETTSNSYQRDGADLFYEVGTARHQKVVSLGTGSNPDARLSDEFLTRAKDNKYGIILVEGHLETSANQTSDLELHVLKKSTGQEVCTVSFPIKVSGVEKMFRHVNFLPDGVAPRGRETELGQPNNFPDKLCSGKKFVFVHGYNVNPEQARGWNAEIFKRLYWSGSKAKFYGVTWYGSESQQTIPVVGLKVTPDYHVNVVHALGTGPSLGAFITSLGDNVTVAAHSLGNMVLSSAIQEGGGHPDNAFMIDAAVALECFNGSLPIENAMMHPDWSNYRNTPSNDRVFASEWYLNTAFAGGDERKKLTWRDRFDKVGGGVYNFYSDSENVLRKHEGDPLSASPQSVGNLLTLIRGGGTYTWALQEKAKGRRITVPDTTLFVGSTYGGWKLSQSFQTSSNLAPHTPSASEATNASDAFLTTTPIFDPGFYLDTDPPFQTRYVHSGAPSWIADLTNSSTGSATAQAHRAQLLAEMFPARTLPAGANICSAFGNSVNFDMPALYKTGWPSERGANTDWQHSDVKDVAYPYIYLLFDKFKTTAHLDQ